MATSLDTGAFLNAFVRMTARRGWPVTMLSDNGTNFVGAEKEIRELVSQLDREQLQRMTSNRGVTWHWNPPLAPHFGGVVESMIKSAKRAISAILRDADINDEELQTTSVGVESLMNSRPQPRSQGVSLLNWVGGKRPWHRLVTCPSYTPKSWVYVIN